MPSGRPDVSQPDEPYEPTPRPMRYGYHPDDQCPDYGDGASWERALALHHRLCARERAALARCASTSSANGSGESLQLAGSHGTAVRPGLANGIDGR